MLEDPAVGEFDDVRVLLRPRLDVKSSRGRWPKRTCGSGSSIAWWPCWPASEEGWHTDEGPMHEVHIAQPFAIGRYEVMFEEYEPFCEARETREAK